MARYAFQGVLTDSSGNIVPSASVKVYVAGTDTFATIYDVKTGGTAIDQGGGTYISTDANGVWKFYVNDSDYPVLSEFKLTFVKGGFTTTTYDDVR